MNFANTKMIWIGVVALGLVWPLVINVILVEFAGHVVPSVAKTILQSGIWSDHDAYVRAMRAITGTVYVVIVGLVFGIPLGVLISRKVAFGSAVFVATVLIASFLWNLSKGYGAIGFYSEWLLPEVWFGLVFVLIMTAVVGRWRSRRIADK